MSDGGLLFLCGPPGGVGCFQPGGVVLPIFCHLCLFVFLCNDLFQLAEEIFCFEVYLGGEAFEGVGGEYAVV